MRSFRRDESVTSQKLSPGILRRIARFARPYRRMLLVFLALIVLDALLSAANPLIYRASSTTASCLTTRAWWSS